MAASPLAWSKDPWRAALVLVGLFTAARLAAVFVTPFELYPDEAQYWLWSRDLAFGYHSKPPMVAWLIALTTAIGGDGEAWIRVSSALLHGGAALVLFRVGRTLYDATTGFWAAALYTLMPGVQLSAGLASTDAPLLFFLSLALWAYVALVRGGPRALSGAAFGVALGLAFLSKYAAIYALVGVAAHAFLGRDARRAWTPAALAAAAAGFVVAAGPNLLWNAAHGFATVEHTAANADWSPGRMFNPAGVLEFLGGQFGVFGPAPFAALLIGAWLYGGRRRAEGPDLLLLCFTAPPLLAVTVQAFLSRANANWAGAAYAAGAVLAAAWLLRWRARGWLLGGAAAQAGVAALFLSIAAAPGIADGLGLANGFKRARGWAETADRVLDRAEAEARAGGLTAVAVDDRFLFNALAYYGRERLARPGAPPLAAWVRHASPHTQAETTDPLTAANGGRVLLAGLTPGYRAEMAADFTRTGPWTETAVRLDPKRERVIGLALAEGFRRAPRDPVTGLPTAP